MSTHLKVILAKMFDAVNFSIDSLPVPLEEFIKQQTWFHEKSWSIKTENDFKVWFCDYLKNNKPAFIELTGRKYLSNNKESRQRLTDEFCWNYGWKIQVEEK